MRKLAFLLTIMAFMGAANAQSHHWTPMSGNQYTMIVNGIVTIDGVTQTANTLEIGAFCGEQCRESVFVTEFQITGEYLAMMNIRSNTATGEIITFRLYDHVTEQELDVQCVNTLDYVADAVIGNIGEWYEFAFISDTPVIHNTTSGNWSNQDIWSAVPGNTSSVEIDADCTVDVDVVVASLTVTDGATLTIQSGKTLIVTGNLASSLVTGIVIEDGAQLINNSGNVYASAKKDIEAYTAKDSDGWYLISSPVDKMAIAGSMFLTENYDLLRYDESTAYWENYKAGHEDFTTFTNGRGYLYANSNSFSPMFTGVLNNDVVVIPVTYTTSQGALKGANIIGNPFPHVIYKGSGGAIDDQHLASGYFSMSFRGGWETHTFEEPIQPGQGILVRTSADAQIRIAKSTNAAESESTVSKNEMQRIKMTVRGSDDEDRAYVYFCEGIGLEKIDNISESIPELSVSDNGKRYAIAHLDSQSESIEMQFKNIKNDDYTITFEMKGIDCDYLHLIDNFTGDDINLLLEPSYTFHANGSEPENRFRIVMKEMTGISENYASTFAYLTNNGVIVNSDGMLEVFDITGRMVSKTMVTGGSIVNGICNTGVYVLRLTNEQGCFTQKIVVR